MAPNSFVTNFNSDHRTEITYKKAAKNLGLNLYIQNKVYDRQNNLVPGMKALHIHRSGNLLKFWDEVEKLKVGLDNDDINR